MVVIFGGAVGDPQILTLEFDEGDEGIPIFGTIAEAEALLRSTDAFGPGWEALELSDAQLLPLLEELSDEVEHVVLNPPPQRSEGGMTAELVGLHEFIERLRDRLQ
ncbi:MAG: hypothetical protein CYG60_12195 [Actinobacteria bacterium]|nr:MAG: hypothetical protein CYG60_12195 [Actinomycetota bacterium]